MKQSMPTRASRSAFTLIEILVVVGIIALLAAILFPVFAKVRGGARTTACNSNLRQLGLAFQQYTTDNGGRYPRAANYQAWSPGHAYWVAGTPADNGGGLATDVKPFTYADGSSANVEGGALFPYVKSGAVYVCPSTPDADKKKLGYSMNCAISLLSQVRILNPSEIILLVDEGQSLNDGFFWASKEAGTNPVAKATDELTQAHNGGGNLLFADGHIKYYTFDAMPIKEDADIRTQTTVGTPRFRDLRFGTKGSAQTGFVSFTDQQAGTFAASGSSACPQN